MKKDWSKEAREKQFTRLMKNIDKNTLDINQVRKRNLARITEDLPRY